MLERSYELQLQMRDAQERMAAEVQKSNKLQQEARDAQLVQVTDSGQGMPATHLLIISHANPAFSFAETRAGIRR